MKTNKPTKNQQPVPPAKSKARSQKPLFSSPAEAKREASKLRRGRERLQSEPMPGDSDARATLI